VLDGMLSIHSSQALEHRSASSTRGSSSSLKIVALLLLGGWLLHSGDHLRRGIEVLTPEVFWAGSVSGAIALAVIALVLAGHRLGPALAVTVGFGLAIGVSVVHLLPHWSALSDSLPDGRVDVFTWAAVLCEIAAALAFGVSGVLAMRRRPSQA